MSLLDAVILAGTLLAVARCARLLRVATSIPRLADLVPPGAPDPGPVTIAVAARDEGEHLEQAARSWLRQDAASLQVVAVDDRSSDRTLGILQALAAEDPRLLPLRVTERPAGWLGKCHALHLAARHATGEYILFTDADVKLAPDTLRRAVRLARLQDADVVVLLPDVESTGVLQRALTGTFFQFFLSALGGRRANADDGRCAVGIGAFNLVRAEAYRAVGGHEPVRMQVGDDVALVRLLQRAGGRHRLLSGEGLVGLRWQPGVLGMIRGLEKNFFWGARFSLLLLGAFSAGSLLLLAPLLAPASGTPLAWTCGAAWAAASALPHLVGAPREGRALNALLHPVSTLLLVVTGWNSALRTLRRGGISWRGDVVPIRELKAALLPWRWWREGIPSRPPRVGSETPSSAGA